MDKEAPAIRGWLAPGRRHLPDGSPGADHLLVKLFHMAVTGVLFARDLCSLCIPDRLPGLPLALSRLLYAGRIYRLEMVWEKNAGGMKTLKENVKCGFKRINHHND